MRVLRRAVLAVVLCCVGCASATAERAEEPVAAPEGTSTSSTAQMTTAPPTTASPTTASPTTAPPTTAPGREPPVPVDETALAGSWRPGCPVGASDLRAVPVSYSSFEGSVENGVLIVRSDLADEVQDIFEEIFAAGIRIRMMSPVSVFGSSDALSMLFDNTSAFNCRTVAGTTRYSRHAYGTAIDVNPMENPWVRSDGSVDPPRAAPYVDRSHVREGMIEPDGPVVAAFTSRGWSWGGHWSEPDFQHFERR